MLVIDWGYVNGISQVITLIGEELLEGERVNMIPGAYANAVQHPTAGV